MHKITLRALWLFSIVVFCSYLEAEPIKQKAKISVQLWSLQDAIENDFKATLQAIADMEFDGVELAGTFGPFIHDPRGLKNYLDSLGLEISGAHVTLENLLGEKFNETLEFYQAMQVTLLIIPWDDRAWDSEKVEELVQELSVISAKLQKHNITLGYHNHAEEFQAFRNATYWDYIAENTPSSLALELDVGWVNYIGGDPVSFVTQYPSRTIAAHIKVRTHENSKQVPIIGLDQYDWRPLFNAMYEVGGTQWLVVEQEEYPAGLTSLQSVYFSKQGLLSILKML